MYTTHTHTRARARARTHTHTHTHTNTHTHTTEMMVRGDEVLEKAFSIRKFDLPYVRKLRNNGRE